MDLTTLGESGCFTHTVAILIEVNKPKLTRLVTNQIHELRNDLYQLRTLPNTSLAKRLAVLRYHHAQEVITNRYLYTPLASESQATPPMPRTLYTHTLNCLAAVYRGWLRWITSGEKEASLHAVTNLAEAVESR